jgi:hypothetical protein
LDLSGSKTTDITQNNKGKKIVIIGGVAANGYSVALVYRHEISLLASY